MKFAVLEFFSPLLVLLDCYSKTIYQFQRVQSTFVTIACENRSFVGFPACQRSSSTVLTGFVGVVAKDKCCCTPGWNAAGTTANK